MRCSRFAGAATLACVAILAWLPASASPVPAVDPSATVVTLASDFVAPEGVAFDAHTMTTIVADAGAHRIDRIAADGSVTTIAGSSAGYRDGPVSDARFDDPQAVAIEADGSIVVADTGNRRIRRIADGVVTTVAASATFTNPRDIAVASDGKLYVADAGTGLRIVSGDAVETSSLAATDGRISNLAVWNGSHPSLFFVTPDGVGRIDLENGTLAARPVGGVEYAPAHIVALDATKFVTSLPRYHALYFSSATPKYPWWRRVSGSPTNDATAAGGFADGPADVARFDAPAGIALDAHGNILVADTGNHRIRRVPALDLRWDSQAALLQPDSHVFRIGFIGNSVAFYNTMWQDSIGGILQQRLTNDAHALRTTKPIEVRSFWLGNALEAQDEYFENAIVPGSFDCVVWALDYNNFIDESHDWPFSDPAFDPQQTAAFARDLAKGVATLRSDRIPFVMTDVPFGFQASPTEDVAFRDQHTTNATPADLAILQTPAEGYAFTTHMESLLGSMHVPYLATYSAMLAYERGPHAPLYPPLENHFSPAGTTWFGNLLADDIERSHACDAPAAAKP